MLPSTRPHFFAAQGQVLTTTKTLSPLYGPKRPTKFWKAVARFCKRTSDEGHSGPSVNFCRFLRATMESGSSAGVPARKEVTPRAQPLVLACQT
jgi:hypothetical protein